MNDHTPRRYRGSLLERAAQLQHAPLPPLPLEPVRAVPPMPARAPEGPTLRVRPAPSEDLPAREPAPVAEPLNAPDPAPVVRPAAEEFTAPAQVTGDDEPVLILEPAFALGFAAEAEPDWSDAEPDWSDAEPFDGDRTGAIDRDLLQQQGMLIPGASITPLAEEFRMVKRQLLLTARAIAAADSVQAADRARMILVCSAHSGEGKTFCAINLALSMAAERDVEILLVDADFGKPDVLQCLGLPAGPGLLDALTGAVEDVEDCIVATDVPQLSVLPAGTRSNSDTELLASDRARAILDGLAAANPRRIVIFDSPPALAASPASVLALHVGQAMLVVRADRTSESDLRETVSTLDGCEHIQLILNAVSFQPGGRRFGSYYVESGQ